MKVRLWLLAWVTMWLSVASFAQTPANEKLDQFFDRLVEKNKAMGSLTLARDGKVLYTRAIGYGQINGAEKKPLTEKSRFRIGSITKMFTATLVLQLVEEGRLKRTATLDKFFPQVPNARKITIEQILWHRSGIPNVKREQNAQRNINTIPVTKEEMLDFIVKTAPDFEPGTKHAYSNSGYQILGLVLEKVTGKPYAQVLKERITAKLGLTDTYLATSTIDVSKNEALTYSNFGDGWKSVAETHPSILYSAGAIVSTPLDLTKFIQALFDGKLVSRASLDQMKLLREGEGQGMEPFTFAGKTFYGHTGGADNYGAWLAYQPEEKLAMAYVTNAKVYPVGDIVTGVFDIYYQKPFQIPTFESVAVSQEVLEKYVGVYSSPEAPVKFTFTRQGTTLYVQTGPQAAIPLEATTQNTFKIDNGTGTGIVITFDTAKGQMTIKRTGGERVFTKEK